MLYFLERKYDGAEGVIEAMIVRAPDEATARKVALDEEYFGPWDLAEESICEPIDPDGPPEVICWRLED